MFLRLFLISLSVALTSCRLAGPFDHLGGIAADGEQTQLILVRHWDWQFTYHEKRHRSHYYLVDLLEGELVRLSPARALFASGTSEEAQFVKISGTNRWAALVTNSDEQRLTVWVTQPTDRPTRRGAVKLAELDLEEDAYAITRSGHHLLTVTDEGLLIRSLVDDSIVERKQDSPLTSLRQEILSRFGDSGPGQWWLTDDLRYVAFVPPWTLENGSPVKSMPATIFGVELDLRNDGLVYDRVGGGFRRCHRLVQLGALRDVESIENNVLLLYGAGHPVLNRMTIAVVDLDLKIRRQVEIAVSFVFGERSFQWVPRAGQVQLVGTEGQTEITTRPSKTGGVLRVISLVGRAVHVYQWDYERGQVTSVEVPWETIAKALAEAD